MMKKLQNKKGFTLAELLVVVAIIAVLIGIAIPTFGAATDRAEYGVELANARSAYGEAKIYYITSGTNTETGTLTGFTNPSYDGVTYAVTTENGQDFLVTLDGSKQIATITFHENGTYTEVLKS